MDEKEILQMAKDVQVVRKMIRRLDPDLTLGLVTGAVIALLVLNLSEDSKHRAGSR